MLPSLRRASPLSLPRLHSFLLLLPLPRNGGMTIRGLVRLRRAGQRKMRKPDSDLSASCSAAAFSLTRPCPVEGFVGTSKHFPHSCLSSARQLRPPTLNLTARREGQARAIFPPSCCENESTAGKTLLVSLKPFIDTSLPSEASYPLPQDGRWLSLTAVISQTENQLRGKLTLLPHADLVFPKPTFCH